MTPKDTEKMSIAGQALIAAWLLADMIGMVVMALLHVRGWVFPVGAFAPLVAPVFFISAIGYGGE